MTFLNLALRKIEALATGIAALAVALVMALGVAEIIGRGVFRAPMHGHVDIIVLTMPLIVFLGISACLRANTHVRMSVLIDLAPPRLKSVLEMLGALIGAFTSFALAFGAYQNFARALRFGDTTPDIHLLTWPSKLVVAICLALLGLRFTLYAFGFLLESLGRPPERDGGLLPEAETGHIPGGASADV